MSLILDGSNGITFPNSSTQSVGFYGFKNRIINGAMVISQRNGTSVSTAQDYTVDRWRAWFSQTYNFQQSNDAPPGFSNSLLVTKTNTTQSTYGYLIQYIEGFNTFDLGFGTANAKTVTISFWVKSSVTGTFTAGIGNATGSTGSASTSFYPATYTINVANTWQQITVTIAGQTSGTWIGASNAAGASVYFNFGATGTATANSWNSGDVQVASTGSANLGTTNGATFYITGVQLEAGSTATSFDYRPYGTELNLCQRYYQGINSATNFSVMGVSSGSNIYTIFLIVSLRSSPSFSGNINIQQYYFNSAGGAQLNQAVAYASLSFGGGVNQFRMVTPGAGASGLATWFDINSGSLQISAEL
jgi:hypothetical protein